MKAAIIEKLQRELRAERTRVAEAEYALSKLNELYKIYLDHKDSVIEYLTQRNAELSEALAAANMRIAELGGEMP